VSDILISLEDKDGNRHWSDVYPDDYDIETTFERARADVVSRYGREPLFFRAYRISEDPFASIADEAGATVRHHNFEDVQ
jgi:hypothetical protein